MELENKYDEGLSCTYDLTYDESFDIFQCGEVLRSSSSLYEPNHKKIKRVFWAIKRVGVRVRRISRYR